MKATGIFATEEEKNECQSLAKAARQTPMIKLSSSQPFFSETAWKRVHKAVYKAALAHGLPEIEGYYGMDEAGEFVTA
jgi:hypothetical protein